MGRRVERGYPRRRRERRRLRLGVRGQLDEGVAAAEGFGEQGLVRDETEAMAADARARRFIFQSRFIFFFRSRVARFDRTRGCLLYTSPSPRDKRQSRMPSSA